MAVSAYVFSLLDYIERLEKFAEHWMSEGNPDYPPEMAEWREIYCIPPVLRTDKQTKRISYLAGVIMIKSDAEALAVILDSCGFDWYDYLENHTINWTIQVPTFVKKEL